MMNTHENKISNKNSIKSNSWITINLDPDNRNHREKILKARELFWGSKDEAYVDWLYYQNPFGRLYCSLAMDEELIVGQYIVIPVDFFINGCRIRGGLSLNTFTHPDYRGKGIFTELAENVYSLLEADGSAFTVGLPNDNSRPGFLKNLKFEERYQVYWMIRLFSPHSEFPLWAKRKIARLPFGPFNKSMFIVRNLEFNTCKHLENAWLEEIWEKEIAKKTTGIVQNPEYISWRYESHPRFEYRFLTATTSGGRPIGYLVWNTRILKSTHSLNYLELMDMVCSDWRCSLALLQIFLEEICCSVDGVGALATLWTRQWFALTALGFIPIIKRSFIYREHICPAKVSDYLKSHRWPLNNSFRDVI